MVFPKIVEDQRYHLWTDALHARALARDAHNDWDRGTYVRWSVTTAWTVLEMSCEEALETPGIGRRFKDNLEAALAAKGLTSIDWSTGIWQRVLSVQRTRKDFVHINASMAGLFPPTSDADAAVATVRHAIQDIFQRVGKPAPVWVSDNDDPGWDDGRTPLPNGQSVVAGVDPSGPDTVRVSFVYQSKEYTYVFVPAGSDLDSYAEQLLHSLGKLRITGIRAYSGETLVYERRIRMRGAS
jgi:hypothetical protein